MLDGLINLRLNTKPRLIEKLLVNLSLLFTTLKIAVVSESFCSFAGSLCVDHLLRSLSTLGQGIAKVRQQSGSVSKTVAVTVDDDSQNTTLSLALFLNIRLVPCLLHKPLISYIAFF